MDTLYLILLAISYLSGSVCSAIVLSKSLSFPDPRQSGSSNPGTTNVLRVAGAGAALMTLLGDMLKAALPMLFAIQLGYSAVEAAWLGVCAVLGHCFPIFFGFKGGKGVACLIAVFIISLPSLALLAIGTWLITAWGFRRSSIASMITALIIPFYSQQFYPTFVFAFACASAVVFSKHRKNIANILRRKEPIIGEQWNENK